MGTVTTPRGFKLGKKDPVASPFGEFKSYFDGGLGAPPAYAHWGGRVTVPWQMDANGPDPAVTIAPAGWGGAGDCVEAGKAHALTTANFDADGHTVPVPTADAVLEQYCLAPKTRVLTASLDWVPLADLQPGDELVTFDEHPPARGQRRRFRRGVVESVQRLRLPCFELEFDDGTTVVASSDHQWLMSHGYRQPEWRRTEDLRSWKTIQVRRLVPTWIRDTSWEAGYLAAAFDGEGWILGGQGRLYGLCVAQKTNGMLEMVTAALKEKGFVFSQAIVSGSPGVNSLAVHGRHQALRFLGSMRPQRLMDKFSVDKLGTLYSSQSHAQLVRSTFVGEREVVAMQTDTRTFIAEGLASHNCVAQSCTPAQLFSDPNAYDLGEDITTSLTGWAQSVQYGVKLPFTATVDIGSTDDIKNGIALGGGLLVGIQLPQSAEDQFPNEWTWEPSSPSLGGHCIWLTGYTDDYVALVTWGQLIQCSWQFLSNVLDEAHAMVMPQAITAGKGPTGLLISKWESDLANLAA